jgi:hypothetical protein
VRVVGRYLSILSLVVVLCVLGREAYRRRKTAG